jgi:hypothetical protein
MVGVMVRRIISSIWKLAFLFRILDNVKQQEIIFLVEFCFSEIILYFHISATCSTVASQLADFRFANLSSGDSIFGTKI